MTDGNNLTLPIDSIQQDVEQILYEFNLIVQADTGTGKSTRLPVWATKLGRVLVIEPRRVACTTLAGFVADTMNSEVGERVGYAIKFDYRFKEKSEVVFATPGVVLRWFSEDKLKGFDVVMIDEFHERRAETDLLAALLIKHDQHRLIVTSATLDNQRLEAYFNAKVIVADAESYGVTIRYHALDSQHMPSGKSIEERVKPVVAHALERGGDVLVFLPGKKEIGQCQSMLKALDVDVIPLHAAVSDSDRFRALHQSDRQRVVLATNVAETSLTIPGIVTVIDSGMERRTHQRNGRTALAPHAISKASAKQRAGRAGRISAGFCERLFGEHAPLEAFTPPELEREDLTETMLAAACCGSALEDLTFLSNLPDKSLNTAKTRLIEMGALAQDGAVTEHGKRIYPLPIDSIFAHLISVMDTKSNTEAMVDLAAILQTQMTVWKRKGGELALDDYRRWNTFSCDVVTAIAVLRGEQPIEIIDVDESALEEARKLSASIREVLELPEWEVASRFSREAFLKSVLSVAPELAYVRREKRQQAFGNGLNEVTLSRDSDFPAEPQAAIVFDQFHLAGRGAKQTTSYATCMAAVPFTWLVDAGLGEESVSEFDDSDGVVVDVIERIYAGRVIGEYRQAAEGESLIRALATQIIDGQLFEGAGTRLVKEVKYWNLYQSLTDAPNNADVDVLSWLEQALQDLGVEAAEDLELIEGGDLVFDGIPSWEFDDFAEKYPLELTLAELKLDVEYQKGKRTVVVHHAGGNRKDGPKRWELPSWSGWKVQYRKASRVIDVR
ncbi:helicase-related protein [Grimontia marina]|uniref:ATP-dependent RNA helicase HrpB n=1 Tax=Grimontia marina TaxID=646534 RepID=A0A128FIL1_9GAMM|nr:helicase-related protein [Grimontia marina]CZF86116.1 ATP-dependent RNA helicase HrpB [Grimontia marina]